MPATGNRSAVRSKRRLTLSLFGHRDTDTEKKLISVALWLKAAGEILLCPGKKMGQNGRLCRRKICLEDFCSRLWVCGSGNRRLPGRNRPSGGVHRQRRS